MLSFIEVCSDNIISCTVAKFPNSVEKGCSLICPFSLLPEVGGQLVPVESPDDMFPPPPSPSQDHTHMNYHSVTNDDDNETPPIVPAKTYKDYRHYSNQELLPPGLEGRGGRHKSVPLPVKMKKLSKKEKRFQLSKDDGAYCELSTIDPVTAVQSDSAGNVRLNPIGPAFLASFPGQPGSPGAVTTSHNGPTPSVAGQPNNGEDFLGSYYVLEVGNFKGGEKEGKGGEETGGEDLPAADYMWDVAHMEREGSGEKGGKKRSDSSRSYENISSPQGIQYENVEVKKTSGPKYENIRMRRCHERQKSSPMGIPQSSGPGGRGEGVGCHDDTAMARRMSTSLPSQSMTGDVARERLIAVANVATDDQRHNNDSPPRVEGRLPRTRRSRERIYEMTPVTFPKRRSSRSEVGGANTDEASDKKPVDKEKTKIDGEAAEICVATATTDRVDTAGAQSFVRDVKKESAKSSVKGVGGKEERDEEPLTKMMELNGLPFAGLVLSSSVAATLSVGEEGEGREEGVVSRQRAETIWDDCRVQREWNQVSRPHPLSFLNQVSSTIIMRGCFCKIAMLGCCFFSPNIHVHRSSRTCIAT